MFNYERDEGLMLDSHNGQEEQKHEEVDTIQLKRQIMNNQIESHLVPLKAQCMIHNKTPYMINQTGDYLFIDSVSSNIDVFSKKDFEYVGNLPFKFNEILNFFTRPFKDTKLPLASIVLDDKLLLVSRPSDSSVIVLNFNDKTKVKEFKAYNHVTCYFEYFNKELLICGGQGFFEIYRI